MISDTRIGSIIQQIEHKGDLFQVIDKLLLRYYRKYNDSAMEYQYLSLVDMQALMRDVGKHLKVK